LRIAAATSSVSLPAPLGPTTSTNRPGPIGSGAMNEGWGFVALMRRGNRRSRRCAPPQHRPPDAPE
jgi:hypothetical protein